MSLQDTLKSIDNSLSKIAEFIEEYKTKSSENYNRYFMFSAKGLDKKNDFSVEFRGSVARLSVYGEEDKLDDDDALKDIRVALMILVEGIEKLSGDVVKENKAVNDECKNVLPVLKKLLLEVPVLNEMKNSR